MSNFYHIQLKYVLHMETVTPLLPTRNPSLLETFLKFRSYSIPINSKNFCSKFEPCIQYGPCCRLINVYGDKHFHNLLLGSPFGKSFIGPLFLLLRSHKVGNNPHLSRFRKSIPSAPLHWGKFSVNNNTY